MLLFFVKSLYRDNFVKSLYCDNFVMSLKLFSIYRGFISRLRGNAVDDRICPVPQLQTNFPALLGPKGLPV